MALKFSMILEAIDRASAPAKRVRASMAGLTAGMKGLRDKAGAAAAGVDRSEEAIAGLAAPAGQADREITGLTRGFRDFGSQVRKVTSDIQSGARSVEFYQTRARRLRQVALGTLFRAAAMQARRLGGALADLPRRLKLVERAGHAAKSSLGWLGGKALGLGKWAAAGAAAAGSFAAFDLFRTAGQFEQFRVQLNRTMGGIAQGGKAMDWVRTFAQETPYELAGVTRAFVKLKELGVDGTDGSLQAAGDAAAAMNRDIGDATDAMLGAMAREYDSLKSFGILASMQGKKVLLSWTQNGKKMTRVVNSDAMAMKKAVQDIWTQMFGGAMVGQSKTLFGIIGNLKDTWSNFLVMVAQAGIFDKVKAGLQQLLDKVNELAGNGTLKKWAGDISRNLEAMWDWAAKFYNDTNWSEVAGDIRTVASALGTAVHFMAELVDWSRKLQPLNPLTGGLLGYLIRRSTDDAPNAKDSGRGRRANPPRTLPRRSSGPAQAGRANAPSRPPRFLPRTSNAPAAGRSAARRLPSPVGKPQAAAQPVAVSGTTKIEVALAGPIKGRVISAKSNNPQVPMSVRVGKIMGGPA